MANYATALTGADLAILRPKANTDMGPSTSFVPPFCQSLLI